MKPKIKLAPRAKANAKPDPKPRVWTEEQLSNVFRDRVNPIRWTVQDAVTLAVWRSLTARMPWLSSDKVPKGCSNAEWSASIAADVLDTIKDWQR